MYKYCHLKNIAHPRLILDLISRGILQLNCHCSSDVSVENVVKTLSPEICSTTV